jgi:AraC family transcriptional regulator of adaptative response / DNA-3-methyladenine glycosylase II
MNNTYSAVVTTGIYCRPGCSATPKRENVRPFAYAAAAEAAGFRPCLRCRPDALPGPARFVIGSEIVCRALQLIGQGALDGATEVQLSRDLGVSERHLRRLFLEHVGATPDAVARSRRAHFARRLLVETDMSLARIGFASGFGSVRQFNRAMRDVFRLTPRDLRERRRRSDLLPAGAALELRLPYRPPLDWDAMTAYLSARAIPGVEAADATAYRRTVVFDGEAGLIELRPEPGSAHLVLGMHPPVVSGLIHLVQRARRIFDLDADAAVIARSLRRDPLMRPLVHARPGLRVPGSFEPFEIGVRAIVGQQISVRAATTIMGRIARALGSQAPFGSVGLDRLFPGPDVLASEDLSALGMTSARGGTVARFAAAVATGDLRLDGSLGLDALVASLRRVRGIGEWTAQYIAMRACGEPDAFPSGDLGLRRALGLPSAAELERVSHAWRPWRAYAAMHLWAPAAGDMRSASSSGARNPL